MAWWIPPWLQPPFTRPTPIGDPYEDPKPHSGYGQRLARWRTIQRMARLIRNPYVLIAALLVVGIILYAYEIKAIIDERTSQLPPPEVGPVDLTTPVTSVQQIPLTPTEAAHAKAAAQRLYRDRNLAKHKLIASLGMQRSPSVQYPKLKTREKTYLNWKSGAPSKAWANYRLSKEYQGKAGGGYGSHFGHNDPPDPTTSSIFGLYGRDFQWHKRRRRYYK